MHGCRSFMAGRIPPIETSNDEVRLCEVIQEFEWLRCSDCFVRRGAAGARAQWAVIDAPAIVQLIQEVQTMAQQLQTAQAAVAAGASRRCRP